MKHPIADPDAQDHHKTHHSTFDISSCLHVLKHYLPAQAPLKDFVHHNTLHAFQNVKFDDALNRASKIFGYRTSMSLKKFRALYDQEQIRDEVLEQVIVNKKGDGQMREWKQKLLFQRVPPHRISSHRSAARQLEKSLSHRHGVAGAHHPVQDRLLLP